MRGNRRFLVGFAMLAGIPVVAVLATLLAVHTQPNASADWMQFSIGPASGESSSINDTALRSNGITLKGAVATAYGMPAVRVIGPPWLSETRYSITAVAAIDDSDTFRALLQQELKNRLGLETHVEDRPFEVFVLTAAETPRLERSPASGPSTWISKHDVRMRDGSMAALASALQNILGRPVIDETAITGSYNVEFGWGEDRVASVTTALRDKFGLRLSTATRDMDALIVDRIWRDPTLVVLAQIGRITRGAPQRVRQHIANALTMR
jgi:uncharacterized protein (TIGR03435 family)